MHAPASEENLPPAALVRATPVESLPHALIHTATLLQSFPPIAYFGSRTPHLYACAAQGDRSLGGNALIAAEVPTRCLFWLAHTPPACMCAQGGRGGGGDATASVVPVRLRGGVVALESSFRGGTRRELLRSLCQVSACRVLIRSRHLKGFRCSEDQSGQTCIATVACAGEVLNYRL
jgi:hypothetical protein